MKLIIAIIRSEHLEGVEAAVSQRQASLMSVSQVLGSVQEPGYTETYRGREVHVRRPKFRLEIAVHDLSVEAALDAVVRATAGDCKAFVLDMGTCVLLHNGAREPAGVGG